MAIVYHTGCESLAPAQLEGFFVGWPAAPSAQTHLDILRNSAEVVWARDDETGQAAGFISAISDGVLAAYIPLLEVRPSYQGRGIGRELLRRMLAQLDGLYMIDLVCDPDRESFYESFGMQRLTAMCVRNHAGRTGRASGQGTGPQRR